MQNTKKKNGLGSFIGLGVTILAAAGGLLGECGSDMEDEVSTSQTTWQVLEDIRVEKTDNMTLCPGEAVYDIRAKAVNLDSYAKNYYYYELYFPDEEVRILSQNVRGSMDDAALDYSFLNTATTSCLPPGAEYDVTYTIAVPEDYTEISCESYDSAMERVETTLGLSEDADQ